MNEQRTCKKCGNAQPIECFPKAKNQRGNVYRTHECKACEKARVRKWNEENREHKARQMAEWRTNLSPELKEAYKAQAARNMSKRNARIRRECYEAYGGAKCACCGEAQYMFLSIDHIENDGAAHRKEISKGRSSASGVSLTNWLKRQFVKTGTWPEGFQVLCMNCQHGKARNGGICPHQEGVTTIPQGSTAKRPEAHRTLKLVG